MDLSSILSLLEKANINTNEVQDLIYEASRLDLSNEDNVRSLIRKSAKLANKDISIEKEKRATYIRILNLLVPESFAIKNENSDKNGIKEIYNNQINGVYFNEIDFI